MLRTPRVVLALSLASALTLGLAACTPNQPSAPSAQEQTKDETIKLQSLNGNKESIEVEVPKNASRVAVMDMSVLDIMDTLGLGDKVVGVSDTSIDYLQSYKENADIKKLGTVKEADLEAVAASEPDVIFIGGRLANIYDELSKIAPTVLVSTNYKEGLLDSTLKNAKSIASIWDKEDEVAAKVDAVRARIDTIKSNAEGKTALVGMYTSGSFNVLGNDSRGSLIGREMGFTNLADGTTTSTHGNEASFETIVAQNPEYMFVLNRDAAIGQGGEAQAKEIVENDLTKNTKAYQEGHIVYLAHPDVWYIADGGLHALDVMVADIETGMGLK